MFLVGDNGVILVDAPRTLVATGLVEGIKNTTDKPVTHFVYSHTHKDHIGGANAIMDVWPEAVIISQEDTKEELESAMEDDPEDPRPLPMVTFKTAASISPAGMILLDEAAAEVVRAADGSSGGSVFKVRLCTGFDVGTFAPHVS